MRWLKFAKSAPLKVLANIPIYQTEAVHSRLFYFREKLKSLGGGRAALAIGTGLKALLQELPSSGPLFPHLRLLSEDERASHFRKVCLRVEVAGDTA